ncbi:hypothetical protein HPB52_018250 [Rhipicephalus sanguineus]|uniref:Uncharacterized protein n=1 Tax=Rhipicephalus sanguineus TaxID=34632 RepID=A0A9D4TB67_RHISA|nr:hypothetical protein HPB52_018250 [Rhipicephalus sanguineus]
MPSISAGSPGHASTASPTAMLHPKGILHPPAPTNGLHMDGGPTLPAGLGAISGLCILRQQRCHLQLAYRTLGLPSGSQEDMLFPPPPPRPALQGLVKIVDLTGLFEGTSPFEMLSSTPGRLPIKDSRPTCRRPVRTPASQPPRA